MPDASPCSGELDAEQEQRNGHSNHQSEKGREAVPDSERHPAKNTSLLKGDTSGCTLGLVDIKTKVEF